MPEVQTDHSETAELSKPQLRIVDLNLLTVFDAVMQEQNITRAAHVLGMSQPAVSNAVARLKVMFNDELFVRYGRGIQPTARAFQLFGSVRQALQLVQNELPGSGFEPASSERVFHLCVCSPLDSILTSQIYNHIEQIAPNIHVMFKSSLNQNTEHQLRYQETEFVISYEDFHRPEFTSVPLFKDVSQTHLVAIAPRWLAEEFAESLELQVLPLPLKQNSRTCYLSWHEAAGRDKGHQWMEEQLVSICKR